MTEEEQAAPPEEEKKKEEDPIATLEASLQECQDKYLRLLAESENARKRMQKERQELTKYAVENVLAEFLFPLDSFEKALHFAESMSDEVKNWATGFEMILGQLREILTNNGVVAYESVGKHFDPHFHEAVEMVETEEVAPGTVVEECVKGYKMGERAIRVARVKVAKAPSKEEELPKNDEQKEG